MIKKRLMVRQGDVLLVEIIDVPKEAKKEKENGDLILAEGEATGHAHRIKNAVGVLYALGVADRILELKKEAVLEHEEHAPIVLPPGNWQVIRQEEYDPILERRRVLD